MRYSRLIVGSCLWVPTVEVDAAVKERMTFSSYFNRDHGIEAFRQRGKWLGLPRYYAQAIHWDFLSKDRIDRRITTPDIKIKVKSDYRTGQQEIVEQLQSRLDKGITGVLIQVPTAGGKTFLGIKAIELLKQRALIVVSKSDLVEHWVEEILLHTNVKRDRIGWVNGDKVIWQGRDIIVGLVHSLALEKLGKDFLNRFGLVVFDEVDRSVPPETFGPVAGLFPAKYRVGLSASLKRKDGLHKILDLHIGESRIIGTQTDKLHAKAVIVRLQETYHIPEHLSAMVRRSILLKKLAKDPLYNKQVAQMVLKVLKTGRTVMVIADHVRQLHSVKEQLLSKGVSDRDMGYYTDSAVDTITLRKKSGRMVESVKKRKVSEQERNETAKRKILLATYGMAAYGTNIPDLAGIVVASPRTDPMQYTGRTERLKEGKSVPVIIELVHVNNPDEKRWMKDRLKVYRRNGNKVTFLDAR